MTADARLDPPPALAARAFARLAALVLPLAGDRPEPAELRRVLVVRPDDRVGNAPRREERRTLVRSLMDGQRCADCGLAYPWYVMALDNGSGQKVDMLKRLANRKASMATILAEVRKRDAVCLNCRAARLHHRSNPREGLGSWAGLRWKIWDEKSALHGPNDK